MCTQVLCEEECEKSMEKYELVTLPSGLQVLVTQLVQAPAQNAYTHTHTRTHAHTHTRKHTHTHT